MVEPNRISLVRDHILSLLEEGKISTGDRIPAAREIATELNISFLKVQQAVESLCQDGVMHSESRRGTFVLPGWETRILPENVCVYNPVETMPWVSDMLKLISDSIPGLRSSFAFKRGVLELRATSHVLTENDQYLDLSDIFKEVYPDRSVFFDKPFRPFEIDGKMVGIPFAFSPRVLFYNPKLFKEAGCPEPGQSWTWKDFLTTVRKLKRRLPADCVINWSPVPHVFMNFVVRAGGRLFSPEADDPVTVDSANVIAGLKCFEQLGELLGSPKRDEDENAADFLSGRVAMRLCGRHFMDQITRAGFEDWSTAPLPLLDRGVDCTAQATDLICIRKSCNNLDLAKRYVKEMLSDTVQDYVGSLKYNIPIRKTSAFQSLDLDDARDALFAIEVAKISTEFNLQPPYPGALMLQGISTLLRRGVNTESGLRELAQVARTILGIQSGLDLKASPKTKFYGS
ncbi:extracellular solute-binding protein [Coraliomargarita algicola]|uniref:Extracellular solute-binding protein n=1 Tax=Coraliomargarita algicola TaxID=3092156 RepID=A0ABZ0RG99_9BACT|nr:extracellular solute-binding protein [Coraliomargarita sp. J2-16]WPJ95190.1 extracellular solute-binding protein [Coraliomargarita sp. J2-16]